MKQNKGIHKINRKRFTLKNSVEGYFIIKV